MQLTNIAGKVRTVKCFLDYIFYLESKIWRTRMTFRIMVRRDIRVCESKWVPLGSKNASTWEIAVPILPPQTLPYTSALLDGQLETSDMVDFFPWLFHIQLFEFSQMPNTKGRILKNPEFLNIRLLEFSLMVNTKSAMNSKKSKIFKLPIPKFPFFLLVLLW